MRYLFPLSNLLTAVFKTLISISTHSSGIRSFSSTRSTFHQAEVSHDTDQGWNNTEGLFFYPEFSPTTGALEYRKIPRQFVQLQLRGSRTWPPSGPIGERVLVATRTMGEFSNGTDPLALLFLGCFSLLCTGLCLLWVFSSPSGQWRFFRFIASAMMSLLFYGLNLCLCVHFLLFDWSCFTIVWVDESAESCFIWVVTLVDSLNKHLEYFQEQRKLKEDDRQLLECIKRKNSGPVDFSRPSGQRSAPRLFLSQANHFVHHLYLPEEQYCPVRHMQDPRYFNHLQKIGAGAFGSIHLVEHRITGKMMAMKTLLRRDNSNEEIHLEIRALLRLQGEPWYPKLLSTFMDPNNFYILMPFYSRGDLYSVMNSCGGCLNRTLAILYLAEIVLAVQGIHKAGIIHRDLKPDNILFDDEGHVIIADFGVAQVFVTDKEEEAFMEDEYPLWEEMKQLGGDKFPLLTPSIDNPHTIKGVAGTPFYAAPEVLAGHHYSYGIDYYSMAIVYHEMVTGYVPIICGSYNGKSDPEIVIDLGRKDVHLQPTSITDFDFLSQMLDVDPYQRPTVKQMKAHPVFSGIDWMKLSQREVSVLPTCAIRKRVPISPGFDRCLTESSRGSIR